MLSNFKQRRQEEGKFKYPREGLNVPGVLDPGKKKLEELRKELEGKKNGKELEGEH